MMPAKLWELKPQRRDAILNAALREFTAQGFDNASTNVIAKDAGLSKPLMFHYVGSKQALFLFVYDYFTELLNTAYFSQMDYSQGDIFERLRQSYLLQMELIKQYPWIFDVQKLSAKTGSDEINKALQERAAKKPASCDSLLFAGIDESNFRAGLDIEKCKQFILWSNIGFTKQIVDDIRKAKATDLDYTRMVATLDEYFAELRKVFYTAPPE